MFFWKYIKEKFEEKNILIIFVIVSSLFIIFSEKHLLDILVIFFSFIIKISNLLVQLYQIKEIIDTWFFHISIW